MSVKKKHCRGPAHAPVRRWRPIRASASRLPSSKRPPSLLRIASADFLPQIEPFPVQYKCICFTKSSLLWLFRDCQTYRSTHPPSSVLSWPLSAARLMTVISKQRLPGAHAKKTTTVSDAGQHLNATHGQFHKDVPTQTDTHTPFFA